MKFDLQALNQIHAMLDRFVFSVGDKKDILMILIITPSSNFAETFGFYALFIKPKLPKNNNIRLHVVVSCHHFKKTVKQTNFYFCSQLVFVNFYY